MTDDAQCLLLYANTRNEAAFAEFVHRHIDLVYAAAYRQSCGEVSEAGDIAQQVFVLAAQKAATLARHPVISAWLFQTTRFLAVDTRRSNERRRARETEAEAMRTLTNSDPPLPWERVSPELDALVASLGERDRAALILRYFGGESFAEIGAKLHVSENTARMRVDRALAKLRVRLNQNGIQSSLGALAALLTQHGVMAAPAGVGAAAIAAALAAPATVAGGGFLALLYFMTPAKITVGVATLVALASIGISVHEHNRAVAAESKLSPAASVPLIAPVASAANTSVAKESLPGPTNPGSPPVTTAKTKSDALGAVLALFDNPTMQKLHAMQARMRLDTQYADLFRQLNITPEQLDHFKDLLVEKQMVGFDSMSAARAQGIEPVREPKAFFQAVNDAERTVDGEIAAMLGSDRYGEFQQYQATLPARTTVALLDQALSYTSAPLTSAQAKDVIQWLNDYGTPAMPPNNPFTVLNSDLGIVQLRPEGMPRIASVLSPAQLNALQSLVQQHDQLFKMRKKIGP